MKKLSLLLIITASLFQNLKPMDLRDLQQDASLLKNEVSIGISESACDSLCADKKPSCCDKAAKFTTANKIGLGCLLLFIMRFIIQNVKSNNSHHDAVNVLMGMKSGEAFTKLDIVKTWPKTFMIVFLALTFGTYVIDQLTQDRTGYETGGAVMWGSAFMNHSFKTLTKKSS